MKQSPWIATALIAVVIAGCSSTGTTGAGGNTAGIARVDVTPASLTLTAGTSRTFTAVARDASGKPVSTDFRWRSSDSGVATVDGGGTAHALKTGTAKITASVGGVTSMAATLTVAPPAVSSGTFLSVNGKSVTNLGGQRWFGGGPVVVTSPGTINGKAVASVQFSVPAEAGLVNDDLSPLTSATATPGGFVIHAFVHQGTAAPARPGDPATTTYTPYNYVTRPNLTLTATLVRFQDGSTATPSGSSASLSFNLDLEPPRPAWDPNGAHRQGSYEAGCGSFPYDVKNGAVTPGTSIAWPYTVSDAGAGVSRVDYLNFYEHANRVSDDKIFEQWVYALDANGRTGDDFKGEANASGSMAFVTLGHGKHYVLRGTDELGNTNIIEQYDWVYDASGTNHNPQHDLICNAYFTESGYPTTDGQASSPANPDYKDALNHHTIPEIGGISGGSARGYSATATGVLGAPPAGTALCYYCGRGPSQVTEVRFYRRVKNRNDLPFEYVGRVLNPTSSTVTYTDPNADDTPSSGYDFGVAVFNALSAVGFADTYSGDNNAYTTSAGSVMP